MMEHPGSTFHFICVLKLICIDPEADHILAKNLLTFHFFLSLRNGEGVELEAIRDPLDFDPLKDSLLATYTRHMAQASKLRVECYICYISAG